VCSEIGGDAVDEIASGSTVGPATIPSKEGCQRYLSGRVNNIGCGIRLPGMHSADVGRPLAVRAFCAGLYIERRYPRDDPQSVAAE
jgi:hypothetical protein